MKSTKKAEKYLENGKVFPIMNTPNVDYWCVEGGTGNWEVTYHKHKDTYRCNCLNVRNTFCSHIKCVQLYKEKDENIKKRKE